MPDDPRLRRRDTTSTLIDLDAPDSTAATGLIDLDAQEPARGTIVPRREPAQPAPQIRDPNSLPTRGRGILRGIASGIGDFLGKAGEYVGPEQIAGTTATRYEEPEGEYGLVRPVDPRSAEQQRAAGRRRVLAVPSAQADIARVAPAGSLRQAEEQKATTAGLAAQETNERNFTPKQLRDLARRGDLHAEELQRKADELAPTNAVAAAALSREAEAAKAKAANAETIASASENADTFGEIARSSLLGIVHDPNAKAKRAMLEYQMDPSLSFAPEEQTRDLGKNLPVGTSRGFDVNKDLLAPLVGSAPLYVAGGIAGRAATRAIAGGLEAINAPRAASIARALSTEIETTGIYGPKQAGMAGLREAGANLRENAGKLLLRGATEGQVIGATQAAREAQQVGADPVQAAVMSTFMNVPFGALPELGLGALTRVLGVADRSVAGALDRVMSAADGYRGVSKDQWLEAIGRTNPPEPEVLSAMDRGAEVAGKTPVSDKTLEGQRVDLAAALETALAAKREATNFGSDVGMIERDPSYLTPIPVEPEVNPPLRSALDVAQERAGIKPEPAPTEAVDATVQMQRAAEEQQRIQTEMAAEQEQLRLEQAAQARAAEKQGPLTLAQTLARAGRDREAGEPLAADYHDAINKFADVAARMEDAKGEPSAALRVQFARARSALNDMRKKYGTQAASAAVLGLAANDEDLTDEERKMAGLGALVIGSTVVHEGAGKGDPFYQHDIGYDGRQLWSRLERAVQLDDFGASKAKPAEQWIARIAKKNQASKGEIETTIMPWLKEQAAAKAQLTKQQVLDAIDERSPNIDIKRIESDPDADEMPSDLVDAIESHRNDAENARENRDDTIASVNKHYLGHFGLEATAEELADASSSRSAFDQYITNLKGQASEVWREDHPDFTDAEEKLWVEQERDPSFETIRDQLDEARTHQRDADEYESNADYLEQYADWNDYREKPASGEQHMGQQEYREMSGASEDSYHEVRVTLDKLAGGGDYQESHWPNDNNVVVHYRARDVTKATVEGTEAARKGIVTPEETALQERLDALNDQLRALNNQEMARLQAAGIDTNDLTTARQHVLPEMLAEANRIRAEREQVEDEIAPLKKKRYKAVQSSARDRTRVMFEVQSNYATQAADAGGFSRTVPVTAERRAALESAYTAAQEAKTKFYRNGGTADARIANQAAQESLVKALEAYAATTPEAERADWSAGYYRSGDADPKSWTYGMLRDFYHEDTMKGISDPGVEEALKGKKDAQRAMDAARDEEDTIGDLAHKTARDLARAGVENPDSPSPASPVASHRDAIALGTKQAFVDAVEAGKDRFAWASPEDRRDMANLGPETADLIYGKWVPGTIEAIHRALGEPFSIEHINMDEYELGSVKLTPSLKEKIRKYGLPFVSVAALMALPDDAEAQDGKGRKRTDLYGTAAGGIAAGGLIATMMTNRKLRALVKENREMSRALHLDDLSGLSNKRALSRAVESIDRDDAIGWIALDANSFKAMNDVHGHPEGDKAIAHFGKVIRDAAEKAGVPMRGFRAGGDEFAFAAPKEHLADLARAIEAASPYTKGEVTTSLTGAYGDTFAEADALLTHTKAQTRVPRGSITYATAAETAQAIAARAAESGVGAGRAGRDANAQPYARRSVEGTGPRRVLGQEVRVVAEHTPDPRYAEKVTARTGHTAPPMLELASDETSAKTFHEAISAARDASEFGAAVYVYDPAEYAGMRLFVSDKGKTGFALKGDDIVSVFSTEKGGRAAHALAIAEGGRTLDAFDTVLPSIYASNGMRVVSRLPWDETQAPPAWKHETFAKFNEGRPDVVFMVHDPAFAGDRLKGDYASSYDEAVQMQQAAKPKPQGGGRPLDLYSNPIGPALQLLRRAPGAAGVAAIGAMMTQSDNEYIRRTGLPVIGMAALNAIGSRRLFAGGDRLASALVEQLRKTRTGTGVVRAFNPDRLIPKEVLDAIKTRERGVATAKARAAQGAKTNKALGPEGDRAVSDVLDNEQWESASAQTADVLSVAMEQLNEITDLTQQQVAAGTLDPGDVIPNYGGPRKYAHYEVANALANKPGKGATGGPNPRIAKTETRTLDIPIREAERALAEAKKFGDPAAIKAAQDAVDEAKLVSYDQRVARGEIRESSYRRAAYVEKAMTNIANAKLFETLRATPGVAHPDWIKAVDEYQAATALKRSVRNGTQADKDAAEILVGNAAATLDELKRRFSQKGQDYTVLPDTPALGMLRGAIVQRDVAHSMEGFGEADTYGKALRAWKEMHTVFNPGTNIGNMLSNVTALHMSDVPMWLQPLYYKRALKDLKSYGEASQALTEAGVMSVNAVNAEGQAVSGGAQRSAEGLEELLTTTRPETADVIRRESEQNSEHAITEPAIAARAKNRLKKGIAIGATVGAARGYEEEHPERTAVGAAIGAGLGALAASGKGDLIRKLYGHEDNIARMAVFIRRRQLGDTKEQALQASMDALGDFRTRSPALRLASRTVSPFVMYQAKAVPAFAKKIIDHPYKWLSLVAAWAALDMISKRNVGEIPEEDRDERDRATWGYMFPGFVQLPITNTEGDKGATDMSRYTPLGGFTTGAPPGSVPDAFGNAPGVATPGGPVIDLALRAANVHPFTKDPLFSRSAPRSENIATALREATDLALPSAAGYHLRQITADYDNRDWDKLKNDLLGPLGTKPRFVRTGSPQQRARYELDSALRDVQYRMRRELQANKNPERDSVIIERAMERQIRAMENYDRRVTPPAKGERP